MYSFKAWHLALLSNTWVLSRVLEVDSEWSHRDILQELDCGSNQLSTFQYLDAWCTSFRMRHLQFSLPASCVLYVSVTRLGSQHEFIISQLCDERPTVSDQAKSILVIYYFDSKDLPLYAGSAEHDGIDGPIRVDSLTKVESQASSTLRIDIGGVIRLYKITTRVAFSSYESRFPIQALGTPDDSRIPVHSSSHIIEFTQPLDNVGGAWLNASQPWTVLARFPPDQGVSHICFVEGIRMLTESRFQIRRRLRRDGKIRGAT